MKRKWRTLFILFFTLLSPKARSATYNFNFYNNDKDEKQVPLAPTLAAPPTPVIPLAPLTENSTAEMAKEKSHEAGPSSFLFGLFYYTRSAPSFDTEELALNGPKYVRRAEGFGLKVGKGKIGGMKVEIEGIKEEGAMLVFLPAGPVENPNVKISSYGLGLNLKKEFLLGALPGIEFGIGGNYLLGKNSKGEEGGQGELAQNSYYASLGLNIYYNQFLSLNGLVKVGQTNTTIKNEQAGTYTTSSTQPTLIAGLTYNF